jgi:vancomycin resistance protein YoaR
LGLRLAAVALLFAGAAGASALTIRSVLPREGEIAPGARLNNERVAPGLSPRTAAQQLSQRWLEHRIVLTWGGERVLETTVGELGGETSLEATAASLHAIARDGDLFARVDEALEARHGHVNATLSLRVPADVLAAKLERIKDERDALPVAAKLKLPSHEVTPHVDGRYLDVLGAAAAIERAAMSGVTEIEAPTFAYAPKASAETVARIDTTQVVSRYETHFGFVGGQANRGQNVTRAASQMDGVVLLPGEVVSFNANVGPRSIDNGFATAPEIFKGELREGVGGGTCQVAGTLHAAAFFGGVRIVERANHSRPSGYIGLGLDATVVYPTTDLKLENTYDFPIVIHASIDKGTLVFELRGKEQPATVTLALETVGRRDFDRKVEEVAGLSEGQFKLKQRGIRGVSVKKIRTIRLQNGTARTEVTTDTYPPTFEIWQVGPNTKPDDVLPPLSPPA